MPKLRRIPSKRIGPIAVSLLSGLLLSSAAGAAGGAGTPPPGETTVALAIHEYLRARSFESNGELQKARRSYEAAVRADPESADLRLEFARFLRSIGLVDDSLAEGEKAIALDPRAKGAYRFLGETRFLAARNDPAAVSRALAELEKGGLPDEGGPPQLSIYAEALLGAGRNDAAAEAYRRLLPSADRLPDEILHKAGEAFTASGDLRKAEEVYRELLSRSPDDGRAAFGLASLLERGGKLSEALELLEPLSDRRPENLLLRAQLGWVMLRARRYEASIRVLEKILVADEKNRPAREYLAMAYSSSGRFDDAARLFVALEKEDPSDLETAFQGAANLTAGGRIDEADAAWELLTKRTEKDTKHRDLWKASIVQRAVGRWNQRKGDEALALLRPVLEVSPSGGALNLALEIFRSRNERARSFEWLARARAFAPTSLELELRELELRAQGGDSTTAERRACEWELTGGRAELAAAVELRHRLGEFAEAAEIARRSAGLFPDDREDLLFRSASNFERAGDIEASRRLFREVLVLDPDHAPALNYLGYMLADAGVELEEAEELIRRAVNLEPTSAAYLDSLGWVSFRRGKLEEARKWLVRASELSPDDWSIQDHLGDLWQALGRGPRAVEAWKKALELSATASDSNEQPDKVEAVRRKIAAGQPE